MRGFVLKGMWPNRMAMHSVCICVCVCVCVFFAASVLLASALKKSFKFTPTVETPGKQGIVV